MTSEIGPRLLDLLEIAATVFCADTTFPRGALDQPREGRAWRRDLHFRFAVRDIAFWDRPVVRQALRETIEFMTDDCVDCAFVAAEFSPTLQSYFRFENTSSDKTRIDDVIMFSGGLDSLAGTLKVLCGSQKRVALVTHFSAQKTIRRQAELIEQLKTRFRDRLLWIPVHVHRRRSPAKESTQRSRSLLFAALGCVVARMLGVDHLQFYENGIVSQNLPLAPPIVGTLATRTTHPRTLMLLSDFLSQVSGRPFEVNNPFEWLTKTEVVQSIAELKMTNMIGRTVSCNHTFKRTAAERHCGSCSQCLDRRFAILANGLAASDRAEDYATDVLFGVRDNEQERALAVEWVRHAIDLAEMPPEKFNETFMDELLRVTSPVQDRKAAFSRSFDMHQRHGRAVVGVLNTLPSSDMDEFPDRSIAAMFASHARTEVSVTPAIAPGPEAPPPRMERSIASDNIVEVVRRGPSSFDVLGIQGYSGPRARILSCLLDVLIEDRQQGRPIREFRGLTGRALADKLNATEYNIRQDIHRIKSDFRASWTAIYDMPPPKDLLIGNRSDKGYFLNPKIHVVTPENVG
ncbi:7-cyano-7-deazaguanine synthase [Maliponia aquimaris]|uniref:7-cyano-7-deazaguanine synthase n=1 Tax=Maliponia aquimaris TaxID=1673631 RepID=A0A238K3E4_9RHOB|nr:7-cyano-7-deazaguanine synthase [Maliponia aquimaris]SMX37438.1 7-cyano-7-deazaguanine synthase [Maliponia aquimaris]